MRIGVCIDRNQESESYMVEGEIVFSPLYEMMASLHVICNPTHHPHNQKWYKRVIESMDESLLVEICEVGSYTNEWMIPIDFSMLDSLMDLELLDSIDELSKMTNAQINKVFKLYEKKLNAKQMQQMIRVLKEYAVSYFARELAFIQPLIIRKLQNVYLLWRQQGIAASLKQIHERLLVNEEGVVFIKDREYHHPWNEVKHIQYTASTFLGPHLVMGVDKGIVHISQCLYLEEGNDEPSEELVSRYSALADPTRLKILRYLKRKPETTMSLAKKLSISEAAVSKQLKILLAADYVYKKRDGYFMLYYLNAEMLEFLTYWIYEYLA